VTHYQVLGVPPAATPADVRRAYLALARRYHPDRLAASGDVEAEERMRAINAAWAVLGDEHRRRDYDAELRATELAGRRPGGPSPGFVPIVDDDTDYAALLDDTPIDGTRVPRALQLVPVVLLVLAVGAASTGMVLQSPGLLALAVGSVVLSVLGFIAAPVFAVMRSRQGDLG
jgi:hypothetical protein